MDEPKMGDNVGVPYAEHVTDRLELDYAELLLNAENTLGDAGQLPSTVEGSLDVSAMAASVVKLRDLAARSESHRKAEKEPFLRAGEIVDAFFFKRLKEPLDNMRKNLNYRIDTYKQRQLAEERARRQAEAEAMRKQMEEARRQLEETEAAAKRARSEATIEQRKAEALLAKVEHDLADAKAEEATLATMAKASSLVGERFEGERSGQVGMRKQAVVFIDDVNKLDLDALRPYLKDDVLLTALRAWAKATNYQQQMPGATIGMRETTVVR